MLPFDAEMGKNQKAIKVLQRLFDAGYVTEKEIVNMTMDEMLALPGVNVAVKGNSAATEKIAVNYQKAVENSKKTVKALLPDGLPGIDDTDVRNQWLNTKSVTFSNVYEAIEFLQNCG